MTPVRYHLGKFPPATLDWPRLIPLLGPASAALARYDGLLLAIPNAHVLLSPLLTQEAVLSSKIEGTRVTMGEVLEFEAGSDAITDLQRGDAEEVINYRHALQGCAAELRARPFTQHLLRSAHHTLMQGVRGKDKNPGSYRTEQNWIGSPDSIIETASFVPIAPEQLQSGMDAWELFFNDSKQMDTLVQLAILHLEFEALHPFKDGNGRIGRMVIPLFLTQRALLKSPDFYISAYLEANRDEYLERLRSVSRDGDWTQWCAFFLRAITAQAIENERKARRILELYDTIKLKAADTTHSQHAIRAVDYIFKVPVFTVPSFIQGAGIPKPTATRIVGILEQNGILGSLKQGRGRKAGIYAFKELINITEGSEVFVSHA